MDCNVVQQFLSQGTWGDAVTAIAAFAAIVAAAFAFLSYRHSKNIYDEIKSDEIIIPGLLHHPGLFVEDHNDCVLRCTLFNKSKRKAYIDSVKAFDTKGSKIAITWSNAIDHLGNVQNPTGLFGLEDSANLLMRRNDGEEFGETTVLVRHSFGKELEIKFEPYKELEEIGDDQ